MISAEALARLVAAPRGAGFAGRLRHLELAAREPGAPAGLRRLVEQLAAQPTARPAKRGAHPSDGLPPRPPGAAPVPLTSSDLAWLVRLPAAPEQVSIRDARRLAELASQVERGTGDDHLIGAYWQPVRDYHDGLRAGAVASDARSRLPTEPPAAASVIAELLMHEQPALGPESAGVAARRMLDRAMGEAQAKAAHDEAVALDQLGAALGG